MSYTNLVEFIHHTRCYVLGTLIAGCASGLQAQPPLHLKTTLQNMILWRGIEVADGLIFSSDLSITDPSGRFSAGFLGGANTKGSYKELSQYVSYTQGGFQLKAIDTYNFSPGATYNNKEFFNYKPSETGRFIDCNLSYHFGEKFPLGISWSTLVYGRDRDDKNEKNVYSSFVYAEYTLYKNDVWQITPCIGTAFALRPSVSAEGKKVNKTMYADSPGITQVALNVSYKMNLFGLQLPLTTMVYWNPKLDQGYFYTGLEFTIF